MTQEGPNHRPASGPALATPTTRDAATSNTAQGHAGIPGSRASLTPDATARAMNHSAKITAHGVAAGKIVNSIQWVQMPQATIKWQVTSHGVRRMLDTWPALARSSDRLRSSLRRPPNGIELRRNTRKPNRGRAKRAEVKAAGVVACSEVFGAFIEL